MNGLIWTPYTNDLAHRLTLKGENYEGPFQVCCFERRGQNIGVPREYGRHILGLPVPDVYPSFDWGAFPTIQYRDGQERAVDELHKGLVQSRGGITQLRMGFGKTLVASVLGHRLATPMLVVVHKEDLLGQWRDTLKRFFGLDAGLIRGNKQDWSGRAMTVATVQTLYSRESTMGHEFWENFGFVVFDEGHRFPCQMFSTVCGRIPARYRLGMSATFRRRDKLERVWEWHIGQMLYEDLSGALTGDYYQPPQASFGFSDSQFNFKGKMNHSRYVTEISNCSEWNKRIALTVDRLAAVGRKIVVLSDRKDQLLALSTMIQTPSAFYSSSVGGKMSRVKGKRVRVGARTLTSEELELAKESMVILATSSKIGEGSSIDALDTIVFATPKAEVEQCVGRIQRPYPGKKRLLIVDPVIGTRYNLALAKKREAVYLRLGFEKVTKYE